MHITTPSPVQLQPLLPLVSPPKMLIPQLDRHLGAPTPKLGGVMTGTPKNRPGKPRKLNLQTQHLQVAHQRVNLDVDFCANRLSGFTELTVVPTSSTLRCVKLDAREMKINRILINGVELADYVHNDQLYINDPCLFEELATRRVPNIRDVCLEEYTVAQHHILQRKLRYIFGLVEDDQLRSQEKPDNLNLEELLILLPENLKPQPSDHPLAHTPSSLVPTNMTPVLFRNRTAGELYNLIQIVIEYEVVNPKNGVHFICPDLGDSALWHVYTANSDYNVSTSSWVPCIDNLLERTIWSIELSIPRSVKDIENKRTSLRKAFEKTLSQKDSVAPALKEGDDSTNEQEEGELKDEQENGELKDEQENGELKDEQEQSEPTIEQDKSVPLVEDSKPEDVSNNDKNDGAIDQEMTDDASASQSRIDISKDNTEPQDMEIDGNEPKSTDEDQQESKIVKEETDNMDIDSNENASSDDDSDIEAAEDDTPRPTATKTVRVGPEQKVDETENPQTTKDFTEGHNEGEEEEEDEEEEEGDSIDLLVCTGDTNNTKESAHPTDISKKVVSWSIFNPVGAHHIGWSVGAFQTAELSNFVDGNAAVAEEEEVFDEFEDIEKDESSPPVVLYFLPGQEELAKNTCIFASKALEFFLKEYGSYPFSSYCIVFVEGPKYPFNNFAGLSILNSNILYPADVIEPMFLVTEDILECIASQWSGINIVPQCFNDIWCTIGIAKFMSFQFIKTLMGTNEYRYQIKKKMDAIVEKDVGRRPIGLLSLQAPVSEDNLDFVRLKAPVILFILDRRMTKTDKSFGFSRVLPKLFLQAMSGDLQSGALSTQHFQYVCEKVNRNRLESFFKQWVHGVGTPIFNISQKFNKKRSMIEVIIRQTQLQLHRAPHPKAETFINDAVSYLSDDVAFPIQQTFLGPMTIRVHEADGTPYEHIVDIKNGVVKFDVQYNTKFKRMKKSREEAEGGLLFLRLGDVLEKPEEVREWKLEEWPKKDEEFLDPFEWLRVDTDFEWIATFNVNQPDYMFGAQLQQDRDIEAQIAAIEYFGQQEKPNAIYCTMLTRTLVDTRYFYGVRMAAAKALTKISTQSTDFIGRFYLLKAFRLLFCFKDSYVPMSNSFEDFGKFFLQKAFPGYLAGIKDDTGVTPKNIRSLLFNLLKYNDNSNNAFLDCYYVSELAKALVKSVVISADDPEMGELGALNSDGDDHKFVDEVVEELLRLRKLDRWVPSYQAEVSYACVEQKIALARAKLIDMPFEELLYLTSTKYDLRIRTLAFRGLFQLGALKNAEILKYFLDICLLEQSAPAFRSGLIKTLVSSIAEVAITGSPSTLDDEEFATSNPKVAQNTTAALPNSAVVVEESLDLDISARRNALAKATIKGTIDLLRKDLSPGKGLQYILWQLLHSSLLSLADRKAVFTLCDILYIPKDKLIVRLPIPCVPFEELKKKIIAKRKDQYVVVIKRQGRFKIQLSTKIILNEQPKKHTRRTELLESAAAASQAQVATPPAHVSQEPVVPVVSASPSVREPSVAVSVAPVESSSVPESNSAPIVSSAGLETSDNGQIASSSAEPQASAPPAKPKLKLKLGLFSASSTPKEEPRPVKVAEAAKDVEPVEVVEPVKAAEPPAHPRESLVARDPYVPTKVTLKLKLATLQALSSRPKQTVVRSSDTKVLFRFADPKNVERLEEISLAHKPKRYVKINTREKSVELSRKPFAAKPKIKFALKIKKETDLSLLVKSEPAGDGI
ncbi:hypothetical protein PUMCH_004653 [Australozyma saopauloensis]|uniref:Transcription initiation factor TFIID subunit 2 n=1 Tax=Australozyma saopauloensis TaxID=291208 RepID=A0AAX4HFL9_9ASCO|nr:hypothetical protein PUMCH_004653 [[Candida] saopauloensis]